jgi:hypothetical protein
MLHIDHGTTSTHCVVFDHDSQVISVGTGNTFPTRLVCEAIRMLQQVQGR